MFASKANKNGLKDTSSRCCSTKQLNVITRIIAVNSY